MSTADGVKYGSFEPEPPSVFSHHSVQRPTLASGHRVHPFTVAVKMTYSPRRWNASFYEPAAAHSDSQKSSTRPTSTDQNRRVEVANANSESEVVRTSFYHCPRYAPVFPRNGATPRGIESVVTSMRNVEETAFSGPMLAAESTMPLTRKLHVGIQPIAQLAMPTKAARG
eukprot:CAMPEP_0174854198 /NCGR_PEP_ID=MMETSP1114-20130205/30348_1 /TAXON_ID=312471 /ORGANISM="Neobodo designis, Strain CCAP 1951/1" /LENGTH=169 /DNA_ID=CAMNT_0016088879 /DNA_START=96 /DNA_END=605 /DNA_ORIENTATION=-